MTDRLFLNEQEVDLDVKSIITLRSQINDIADLSTRNSSFSFEITLAYTKRNRLVMESAEQATSATMLPYRKMSAKIIKDGVEVVPYGSAHIESASDGYKVQVVFGGYDFWEAIDGKLLSDLGAVDTSREIFVDPNLPTSLPYSFIDPFGASSYTDGLIQQTSSAAGTEAVVLNYGDFTFLSRFATFRLEVRTGAWGGLLADGPQELNVVVGANQYTLATDVQPNTTYVKYVFCQADQVASSANYGVNFYSTFTGSGVVNEVTYLRITESPSLTSMDHPFGIQALNDSRVNEGGYKYPVIDYGDIDNITPTINPKSQRPAVFASAIMEAIVKEAGFIPQGKLFADPRFKKQLHPFTNDKVRHSERWIAQQKFRAHVLDQSFTVGNAFPVLKYFGLDDKSSAGYYDNGSRVTLGAWSPASGFPSSYYSYPEPGTYKYNLTVTFTISGFGAGSAFSIEINSALLYDHRESGLGDGTFTKTFEVTLDVPNVAVTPFEIPVVTMLDCVVSFTDSVFEGTPTAIGAGITYGSTWEIGANLDEMSQKDFLKSIMQMYCIVPDVDKYSKEVKFRFFNEIIENKAIAVDWSDKVNEKGKSTLYYTVGNYAQKNSLNYATDADDEQMPKKYAYGLFSCDNNNLKGEQSVFELKFAPTATDLRLANIRIPIIKKIENGVFDRKTLPRVLIDDTQDITVATITWDDGTDSFADTKNIPLSFFAKGTPFDLWFDSVIATRIPDDPTGLIYDYYQGLIGMLESAKSITVDMNITPADFADLDHFIPRYIAKFGAHFYVNVLDKFTGAKDSGAEVQLIRI